MVCHLCARPLPSSPTVSGGHSYCCVGCREVFESFGSGIIRPDIEVSQSAQAMAARTSASNGAELFLRIDGMHCSSCEFLIEKVARGIDGVLSITSSYATSTARVIYDPEVLDGSRVPGLLNCYGYKARLRSHGAELQDDRLSLLRVIAATSLASVIMMAYLAFYYPTHLGLVDYATLEPVRNIAFVAAPIFIFVLTTVLIIGPGAEILRGAWIGIRSGVLNMDDLLAIAILAAYFYSVAQLARGSTEFYFDVAATIVTVVTVGRYFEKCAREEATRELSKLLDAVSTTARVRQGNSVLTKAIGDLRTGDRIVVWPGEPVPVDGIIRKGSGSVDESLMTGEPFPVRRVVGQSVPGGVVLVDGEIEIEVGEKVENQLATLARVMWDAQSSIAGARGFSDQVARIFIPTVLALAAAATLLMLAWGYPPDAAILVGLTTLIVSCPCTFGLANPLASAVAVSAALKRGIIFTSADVFETAPRIDIVAIDKTGTLSTGKMVVARTYGGEEAMRLAAAVERHSDHPIAKAIAALDDCYEVDDFTNFPGEGAVGRVGDRQVAVGSHSLISQLGWCIPANVAKAASIGSVEGVISYVGWDGDVHGLIETSDEPRSEWQEVVRRLRERVRVVLLTGAAHPGSYRTYVDDAYASVPPQAKAMVVRGLRREGRVVMIGDGSNDAPALAEADLGIAFGAPTGLAAQAADVVIPGSRLDRVFDAFDIIDTTRRRIRQNLGWALLYNSAAITLAVTGNLNPLFAALTMVSSSLLVVWNSSRPHTRNEVPAIAAEAS